MIQNSSCASSPITGCISSKTDWLESILCCCKASSPLRRLPNSKAARMVKAFASPIPLNSISCFRDNFPRALKLLSTLAKIRLHSSTALSFLLPEPIKIATNSASLNAAFPLSLNFSRGRSSCDQFFMENEGSFSDIDAT